MCHVMSETGKRRKALGNDDCKRARKLLSVLGHHYTKKEMRRMKKRATPLYKRVLHSVNVFLLTISNTTPIWSVFSVKKDTKGKLLVEPILDQPNIVVCEEKSISAELIQKKCNQFLPEFAESDDRVKLYHLIDKGYLECTKKKRVYQMNKTMNSCIVLDHATKFAQFMRDGHGGPKRMLKKLGTIIHYSRNFGKTEEAKKTERILFCKKQILTFSDDIIELVKNGEKVSVKAAKKPKALVAKAVVIDLEKEEEEVLTEISTDEAIQLLEGMMDI